MADVHWMLPGQTPSDKTASPEEREQQLQWKLYIINLLSAKPNEHLPYLRISCTTLYSSLTEKTGMQVIHRYKTTTMKGKENCTKI